MLQQLNHFDYIIAGGGLSGLSLALNIQKKLPEKSVLIIDRDEKKANDRTWSFWTLPHENIPNIEVKSWKKIKVAGPGFDQTLNISPYEYRTIQGIDFYNFAKTELQKSSHIHFLQSNIIRLDNDSGVVWFDNGTSVKGELIFKSYFDVNQLSIPNNYPFLHQQFKGWVIETETPYFDDSVVTMMDFISPKKPTKDLRFFYILPFSPTKALVEYTIFARELESEIYYDELISWYIQHQLKINQFNVLETEFSSIPMTNYPFDSKINGKVLQIGTIAGFVKPSSGYMFTRTFTKINTITKQLVDENPTQINACRSPFHYRLFDSILLDLLYNNKVSAQKVFANLYTSLPPPLLFRFLDEKASWKDILSVMLACPQKQKFSISFLKQLFKAQRI